LRPETLKQLLRPEVFGDLVEETIGRIRADYNVLGERDSYRAMRFQLYNRSRFHVGINAWSMSFGAWPVLPLLDRNLFECLGGIPTASLSDRLLQNELVATRFPELAALPLDRNIMDPFPLRPRFRSLLGWYLLGRHARALHRTLHGGEQRYYYRIYDINNPGWVAIRRQAEPYRDRVAPLFNMDVLSELLPPPDAPLRLEDGVRDASGRKTLLGLLLWANEYLS
jgi:asparagine synthase (glutamine-hydrolysing)